MQQTTTGLSAISSYNAVMFYRNNIIDGATTSLTGSLSSFDIDAGFFYKFSIQPIVTVPVANNSTGSFTIQASLDGNNWMTVQQLDYTGSSFVNSGSISQFTGKFTDVRILYQRSGTVGNLTSSCYLIAST